MRFLRSVIARVRSCSRACLLAAALPVIATSCEQAVELSGTVTVPVDVQQLFSVEQPGVVVVWMTKAGGFSSLRYLCGSLEQPLTLPYRIDQLGCAEEQAVEARAFRVGPRDLGRVRCDAPDMASVGGGLRGEELAYGTSTIFPGEDSSPCDSGATTADVTMAVGAAP